MRSAEEKEAKGVAPRGKAVFSQCDGGFRPSWRFWRDFSVFSSQVALQSGSSCVDAFPPRFAGAQVVMLIHPAKPLFAWTDLEDLPQLLSIKQVLCSLPDDALLEGLRAARGKGRDDYPVGVLWGVVLLSILCRHLHVE